MVLEISRRIFRGALPLPSGRTERLDPGRKFYTGVNPADANPGMNEEPVIDLHSDDFFMGEALRQAARAYEAEETPVGAVIVREGRIIARAFNQVELLKDATAHAEMLALTQAQEAVGDWRLTDCSLYVTKEPCPMCAGAIVHIRLARVIFGAADPKGGAAGSALNLLQFPTLNHKCDITGGVREAECRALLKNFFAEQRAKSSSEKTKKWG
jgi:tRNA(adenine34) deaminase